MIRLCRARSVFEAALPRVSSASEPSRCFGPGSPPRSGRPCWAECGAEGKTDHIGTRFQWVTRKPESHPLVSYKVRAVPPPSREIQPAHGATAESSKVTLTNPIPQGEYPSGDHTPRGSSLSGTMEWKGNLYLTNADVTVQSPASTPNRYAYLFSCKCEHHSRLFILGTHSRGASPSYFDFVHR